MLVALIRRSMVMLLSSICRRIVPCPISETIVEIVVGVIVSLLIVGAIVSLGELIIGIVHLLNNI